MDLAATQSFDIVNPKLTLRRPRALTAVPVEVVSASRAKESRSTPVLVSSSMKLTLTLPHDSQMFLSTPDDVTAIVRACTQVRGFFLR